MKIKTILNIVLFIGCIQLSFAASPLSQFLQKSDLTSQERVLLKERIKLFKLDIRLNREDENSKDSAAKFNAKAEPTNSYADKVRAELDKDLSKDYLSWAQGELGLCSDGNCLRTEVSGKVLIDEAGVEHCYPTTGCNYYKCMEGQYSCMDVGVGYFSKLAKPTCESYVANIKKDLFSKKGVDWIYRVMVCLQKGLFEECQVKGNCAKSESNQATCDYIVDFTLKFHPGCYLESGVGVCKLPLKDQINIWKTVGPYLTNRERIEAFKVVRSCLFGR